MQQREEEAARRAEERRRQPPAAAPSVPTTASEGTWRRGGPSAAAPSARTPPRSESPAPPSGPARLLGRGGATPAWRLREQAKSASSAAGSGPPASPAHEEQPKKVENKDDGFQAPKNVWKSSRLRGQQ